jgi:hypothetical protein
MKHKNKKWIYINKCPFRTGSSIAQCIHPTNVHEGKPHDCLLAPCPFYRTGHYILIEQFAKGEKIWVWQARMRKEAGPVDIHPTKVVIDDTPSKWEGS